MIKSLKRCFRKVTGQYKKDYELRHAVACGNLLEMRKLIDLGANVNSEDFDILTAAVSFKKIDALKMLLKEGANPDNHDREAYSLAVYAGFVDFVKILIQAGVTVKLPPNHIKEQYDAVRHGNEEIVKMLVEAGADYSRISFKKLEEEGKSNIAKIIKDGLEKRKARNELSSNKIKPS